jgi:hypothetical protein
MQARVDLAGGATHMWTLRAASLAAATLEVALPANDPITLRIRAPADTGLALFSTTQGDLTTGIGPVDQIGGSQSESISIG